MSLNERTEAALAAATNAKMGAWMFSQSPTIAKTAASLNALTHAVQIRNATGIDVTKAVYQPSGTNVIVSGDIYNSIRGTEAQRGAAITAANVNQVNTMVQPLAQATVKYESALIRETNNIEHYNTIYEKYTEIIREGTPGTEDKGLFGDLFSDWKNIAVIGVVAIGGLIALSMAVKR
jgi:hypothetical protein